MTPVFRLVACTIAAVLWIGAIVCKHFFADIDVGAFCAACGALITALGLHGAMQPSDKQGGYASLPMMVLLAGICLTLTGCTTTMRAWEAAAYSEAKAADDNVLDTLKVAFCAQPLSAFLRNTDMIAGAKALCLPAGNASDPAGLLAGKQPITVNLVLPAPAASGVK